MDKLATVAKQADLIPRSSDELSLANRSGLSLPNDTGLALARLMDEVQAACPNQILLPETVNQYLARWEDLVQRFGLEDFRAGLLRAMRRSEFVPSPAVIEEWCEALARDKGDQARGSKAVNDVDKWKAKWEQDRTMGPVELSEDEQAAERRNQERVAPALAKRGQVLPPEGEAA